MAELRWVLLALGVLLVVGVYLWGRRSLHRGEVSRGRRRFRSEPRISSDDEPTSEEILFQRPAGEVEPQITTAEPSESPRVESAASETAIEQPKPTSPTAASKRMPERIVALRFVPRSHYLDAMTAVAALREAGLEHGRYGIFHLHDDEHPDEPKFSVASLTEPGSFDLERLAGKPLAGMSFFMVLPGARDPVDRFDAMVGTARALAHKLDAELFDDAGSSWSIQRERYIREELIAYRLQSASS
nr:hypothetical protein [Gammaproteobacteria bacterium]